ncbi:molybdopterin-guanine dinucleotide biosynthesis protein B [Cohnella caldifontis]|uniref:molybdopterin-guanine dinucleotide biosynthesis protein B n=1 Tax=Cohnella caldifontis TaxID=3027471 RepID=UPI0023EBEAD4|nr:molybdopterin-guanine dinucleotide biosynthesis protein B [Cohnella sp. YIM B05605]
MKILQIVGYKNAGKTTIAREIVSMLTAEGLRVGTIKRDAHDADPEPDGADTRLLREAGALVSALSSDARTLWVRERPASLEELLAAMQEEAVDVAIVEGFKSAPHPKLALLRDEADLELLGLSGLAAIVLPGPCPAAEQAALPAGIPVFRTDGRRFGTLLEYVRSQLLD